MAFDKKIRSTNNLNGMPYLHRSGKPLDEVNFVTAESAGQLSFLDECDGICGI